MDTLTTVIINVLQTHLVGGVKISHLLILLIGSIFPVIVGLILPRIHTIQYGIAINKFLGGVLLQKRAFNVSIPGSIIHTIQTTFQDISFGVYIDSRKDLTEDQRKQRIEEYLGQTVTKKDEV